MPFSLGGITLIQDPAATKRGTSTAQVVDKLPLQLRAMRSLACKVPLFSDLLFHMRPLSWPCGAGRPAYRERFHRHNFAQERIGRTDRGPAEPHGAYIPNSGLPAALRGGGPLAGPADSLIAAAHYARCVPRCDCCRFAACPRVL